MGDSIISVEKEDGYRPPSSFFYEMRDSNQSRTSCNKTKCKLFIITCGLCTGGVFLVKYIINNWSALENIS
jgi:hypothetical protein